MSQRRVPDSADVRCHRRARKQQRWKIKKRVHPVRPAGDKSVKFAERALRPRVQPALFRKSRRKLHDHQRRGNEKEKRREKPQTYRRCSVVRRRCNPTRPQYGRDVEQQHVPQSHHAAGGLIFRCGAAVELTRSGPARESARLPAENCEETDPSNLPALATFRKIATRPSCRKITRSASFFARCVSCVTTIDVLCSVFFNFSNQVAHVRRHQRVDHRRWLVVQNRFRIFRQRPRNRHRALRSRAQVCRQPVGIFGDLEHLQQLGYFFFDFRPRQPCRRESPEETQYSPPRSANRTARPIEIPSSPVCRIFENCSSVKAVTSCPATIMCPSSGSKNPSSSFKRHRFSHAAAPHDHSRLASIDEKSSRPSARRYRQTISKRFGIRCSGRSSFRSPANPRSSPLRSPPASSYS